VLRPGDQAPGFSLPDQDGALVSLEAMLGRGPLILFFYPADFTPVCTREACLFRDAYAELAAAGFCVAGISPNTSESHGRFRAAHGLGYPLLADPGKTAIKAYGVDGPFGFGVRRATFLIGADGRIEDAVRADLRLGPHGALLRRARKTGSDPFFGEGV
jgi:peroxiredoxin Q/BCP